ncbi:hypothetical protein HZ326_2289 [Fusarium oxysporum f. sp. albedinis]|nr:hypothetical protein HZ326_2289 [Fusarium oxysporum f. sp. albedinis]
MRFLIRGIIPDTTYLDTTSNIARNNHSGCIKPKFFPQTAIQPETLKLRIIKASSYNAPKKPYSFECSCR